MKLTGITQIDELIDPFCKHWITEIYGESTPVVSIMHYVMAYRSREDQVYVLLNLEFGGIDSLYLVKLCRIFNCNLENILVSRAFRLSETVKALEELSQVRNSLILLVYPYNYVSVDPRKYHEATRITGLISKVASSNQVVLFNAVTRYGKYMPEGGSFHHHVVKVIVRVIKRGNSLIAELVKHPVKEKHWRIIPLSVLKHPVREQGKTTILRWIREDTTQAFSASRCILGNTLDLHSAIASTQ
ncbi:MAG: hypothetical protein QXT64_04620 [Desulfurococcaceae archaeon]